MDTIRGNDPHLAGRSRLLSNTYSNSANRKGHPVAILQTHLYHQEAIREVLRQAHTALEVRHRDSIRTAAGLHLHLL